MTYLASAQLVAGWAQWHHAQRGSFYLTHSLALTHDTRVAGNLVVKYSVCGGFKYIVFAMSSAQNKLNTLSSSVSSPLHT